MAKYHVHGGNDFGSEYEGSKSTACKKYKTIQQAIAAAEQIERLYPLSDGDYIMVDEYSNTDTRTAAIITNKKRQYPYNYKTASNG